MTWLDQVDAYVAENRHSDRSFVRSVLAGGGSRAGLRRWAIQKYHQVYDQNRTFSAVHSNAPFEDVRKFMVEQLIAEETSLTSGSDSHYELMARFALAMGATRQDLAETPVAAPVKRFVSFMMKKCTAPVFLEGMLPIYVNESQTFGAADKLFAHLKAQYSLNDQDLEWFSEHGSADREHSRRARNLMAKYAPVYPEFELRALEITKEACAEWLNLHEFYCSLL